MSFSEFTKKDRDLIKKEYAPLEQLARERCKSEEELQTVQRAFEFANEAHKNVRRRSGEPYMIHPIAVATIVVKDIGLGYKSISAALLHDVVEDTSYTVEDIKALFGDKIASLVDGLTKIKTVLDEKSTLAVETSQAENFKKILLTLGDDARVVLIKLADRLHNCRTIDSMPEHKRDKILSETMFIFIPLAYRLGLYEIKVEMENIWLRYKEPAAYEEISRRVNLDKAQMEEEISEFIAPIKRALESTGFNFQIKTRVKTPYSIWHKMKSKNVSFDQIYDLFAIRIIFDPPKDSYENERDECYHIFSIVTGIYRYQSERIRDWVKHPKSNGYEALHCTLMSNSGRWVEVQIRTRRMDDIAEKGIAAHWAYKNEGYTSEKDSEMDKWLLKVKDILSQKDDISASELLDMFHDDLAGSEIVVFTRKGEQKTVAKGSTALDFAYMTNSEEASRAVASKINMKLSSLSKVLHPGDQVEIITTDSGVPKVEWLSFLTTRHAINHVLEYFRKDFDSLRQKGAEVFKQMCGRDISTLTPVEKRNIIIFTQLSGPDELCFRLALGMISAPELQAALSGWDSRTPPGKVLDLGSAGKFVIASCCKPIPGDAILGFLAPDDDMVIIHKKSCEVAQGIAAKYGKRVVSVDWSQITLSSSFPVKISLKGIDRMGLLSDITHVISMVMGVNMKQLRLSTSEGLFEGYIEMYVSDGKELDKLLSRLASINGIEDALRTDI